MGLATDEDMTKVVHDSMQCLASGWQVNFNGLWNVSSQAVVLPAEKIVIGLANNWAKPFKVATFGGQPCGKAWCQGVATSDSSKPARVRGFMYWSISYGGSLAKNLSSTMSSC